MRSRLFIVLLCLAASSVRAEVSPYAGQGQQPIKALSADEIEGLLQGSGMGLAKAAELNGYPGPLHVLQLAGELDLSAEQSAAVFDVWHRMNESARALGRDIVDRERALDRLFRDSRIDAKVLEHRTAEIGILQARLRAVHLTAHLETRKLLSDEQVMRYDILRGYAAIPSTRTSTGTTPRMTVAADAARLES